ncbi:MAG: VOC family protein [Anaerolineae bacterium]|jgi:catechol 2,3-dioxygenase-like lactoylglutathione lyase family enzyme
MIKGVHHTCITVSDLDRSLTFYRDLLGLELVMTEESERSGDDRSKALGVPKAKVKLAILRAGDAQVELIEYVTAKGRPYDRNNNDAGAMHIAFQVEDIDAVYQRLLDHGVRFTASPATIPAGPMAGWRWTYFFDPDGVSLEIIQTG